MDVVGSWRPSTSLVRAASTSTALAMLALVTGRPDLLVLAAPLVVHSVAAFLRRPAGGVAGTTNRAVRRWARRRCGRARARR